MVDGIKRCPVEIAFDHIGRKWAIKIVYELHMGKTKFREFINASPNLSTKMLSQRLKELEKDGLIRKRIVSKTPLKAEYELTEKGKALNQVLYDLAIFAGEHYPKEVFEHTPPKFNRKEFSVLTKSILKMK